MLESILNEAAVEVRNVLVDACQGASYMHTGDGLVVAEGTSPNECQSQARDCAIGLEVAGFVDN